MQTLVVALRAVQLLAIAALVCGCARFAPGPSIAIQNPLFVPAANRDELWDYVVDSVDNYFDIEREERVKQVGDYLTVGRLDTVPIGGATYLEPWRRDTVTPYDRLESTLQSTRRRATVQVVPAEGGFLVDVAVYKELEDVQRPDFSPVNSAVFRNNNSVERAETLVGPQAASLGWIPQGRDPALEFRILETIADRTAPQPVVKRRSWFGVFSP